MNMDQIIYSVTWFLIAGFIILISVSALLQWLKGTWTEIEDEDKKRIQISK